MTERDYAIRSFKEITLNAARHTEERMDQVSGKEKSTCDPADSDCILCRTSHR